VEAFDNDQRNQNPAHFLSIARALRTENAATQAQTAHTAVGAAAVFAGTRSELDLEIQLVSKPGAFEIESPDAVSLCQYLAHATYHSTAMNENHS
jgi:hypothetical protein